MTGSCRNMCKHFSFCANGWPATLENRKTDIKINSNMQQIQGTGNEQTENRVHWFNY